MPTQHDHILSVRIPRSLLERIEKCIPLAYRGYHFDSWRRGGKTRATLDALRLWCEAVEKKNAK